MLCFRRLSSVEMPISDCRTSCTWLGASPAEAAAGLGTGGPFPFVGAGGGGPMLSAEGLSNDMLPVLSRCWLGGSKSADAEWSAMVAGDGSGRLSFGRSGWRDSGV